jgi:hypothetical protein
MNLVELVDNSSLVELVDNSSLVELVDNSSLVELVDNSRTDKNTIHSYLHLYQELLISKNMWSNFYKFNSIWIRYD